MEFLIIIILFILLVISVSFNVVHDKRVNSMKHQLNLIEQGTSKSLVKTNLNKSSDELVDQINRLILRLDDIESRYKRVSLNQRQMISSIAHDFRTPLTSILGYIQMLQNNPHDDTKKHYLSIIEQRSKNLTDLIEDFYQLSLIDSEDFEIQLSSLNPKLVLQEQVALYYDELKKVFLSVTISMTDSSVYVIAQESALKRIFSNLIKNAMIHGVGNFNVDVNENDKWVVFCFSNDVKHPEKINIEKIFDRLYTKSNQSAVKSTGLGLNIAKSLAQKIGGDLSAKVENNQIIFSLKLLK